MRSPFRAKHHVVMQYMAAGPKCFPPPMDRPPARPRQPDPPWPEPPCSQTPPEVSMAGGGQGGPGRIDKQRRIDDINAAAMLQGTSNCSCLEHCFLFLLFLVLNVRDSAVETKLCTNEGFVDWGCCTSKERTLKIFILFILLGHHDKQGHGNHFVPLDLDVMSLIPTFQMFMSASLSPVSMEEPVRTMLTTTAVSVAQASLDPSVKVKNFCQ